MHFPAHENIGAASLPAEVCADDLPLQRIYHWEKHFPAQPFLSQPSGGCVRTWTWAEALNESRRIAAWLQAQQWPAQSHVAILSKNSAWWIMAEIAIWMAGHVTVPVYASLAPRSTQALLEHCEAAACFLGPVENADVLAVIPQSCTKVRFSNAPPCVTALNWDDVVAKTEPLSADPLRAATDIATVIYTSGTTGSPKGAIHRFTSFVYFERAVAQVIGSGSDHRVLSYLPLAHIAERALTETPALCRGWHIFFCENVATFLTDLKRARPTIFFSVPRLFMKFQQGVFEKLQKRILDRALGIPLLGPKLAKRILHQLGLDTVCLAACGSAALPLDVLLWFRGLGLPLIEGYGATETGITHVPPNGESRPGYVGKGVPGVETKLGENAEILIRSPMNMVGYLKDSAQTMEMITADGFIRTGDIGELSPDGWLRICGRLKDQFKTSKGEYVSPVRIEMLLTHSGVVETSLVMGSGLPAPFAVVVLSEKAAAEPRNVIEIALHDILQSVNSMLSSHERVKFLVVEPAAWTIANGYVTPTHKLKRSALELHYKPLIDSWVRQDTQIVWQELE